MRSSLVALCAVAALGGIESPAIADTEDPALQEIAVAYYAAKYRLTTTEATRRVAIQDRSAGIDDEISQLLGADFAGIWFDASDGGRLEVGLTSAGMTRYREVMAIVNAHGLAADTRTMGVRFTIAELERKQASIRDYLFSMVRGGHAKTSYSPRTNTVVVTTLTTLPADEETLIRQVSADDGVTVQRVNVTSLQSSLQSCGISSCNPPLRGGFFIRGENSQFFTGCTGSFVARHRVNQNDLLLITAGHCINPSTGSGLNATWSARNEAGTFLPIGTGYGFVFGGSAGMDAGVVHINPGMSWALPAPVPQVVVKGSSQTTYNPNYKIKHDSASSMGQLLCVTGAMTSTHCAEVSGLGADAMTDVGIALKNLGELDWCGSIDGDSGAPVYKVNKAFGLLVGGANQPPFHCVTNYQGIRSAENMMNVDILLSP